VSRHRYSCPLRWGDLDAQGHANNAAYLDYLQEARVDFLLSGPPELGDLLATGVLVVTHQVEYRAPVPFDPHPLEIELWVDAVGASRFGIGYEMRRTGPNAAELVARARTTAVPYDLAGGGLRRLTAVERTAFAGVQESSEPLRPVAKGRVGDGAFAYPLRVRWSDVDSYGHVNNVKYFDYVQEARIALLAETVGWSSEEVWVVARQDLEYLQPLDFRPDPYAVRTVVSQIGTRSVTLEVQIDDPATGTVFATARTVMVGARPVTEDQRNALAARSG